MKVEKGMVDKKELKRQYKEALPPMGVFKIENTVNGKILIGSTKNLPGKSNSTMFQLKQGTHMNKTLQQEYKQFGAAGFIFTVLDTLEPQEGIHYDYTEDLTTLENMWLQKLQPYGEKGYNKRKL